MDISVQTGGLIRVWGRETGYRMIREAGFDGIDWNLDGALKRDQLKDKIIPHCIFEDSLEEIREYYREHLECIHKNGLKLIQAHAPFPAYVKDFPEFNDYLIRITQQCIRFCAEVGVKYLVVHGISLAMEDYTQTPETIREMNLHLYESLIPVVRDTDVVICLENLFTHHQGRVVEGVCSDPNEAIWYIDELNRKAGRECFAFCLDTGHLNLLGKNQAVFIRKLGTRIKALHIHDNRGTQDEHLAPYTGNIVWRDFVDGLRDIGYTGSLNFETFMQVLPPRVDPEAVPIWLKTIYEIGAMFREKITGEATPR